RAGRPGQPRPLHAAGPAGAGRAQGAGGGRRRQARAGPHLQPRPRDLAPHGPRDRAPLDRHGPRRMKRRGSRLAHLAAVCGLAAACTRPPTPTSPDPGSDTAIAPSTPIRHARGEVLDVTVPLLAGHALALAELRGRVVVLEITAASEPSWPASFAAYNHL